MASDPNDETTDGIETSEPENLGLAVSSSHMRNYCLLLSYDGTDFKGWQTQPGYRTVQATLEEALVTIVGGRVRCRASGRTDAGVHAVGQVVNFFTDSQIAPLSLLRALNSRLPDDISVLKSSLATQAFDANKDAIRKMYRYVILSGRIASPFMRRYASHCKFSLDVEKMKRASSVLLGRHDFHSFETNWPNRHSSIRTITRCAVSRVGDYVWIDVEANGFLYNMVRSIAGTLIQIGRGYWPESRMEEILYAEDRNEAGPTAPPQGLYLMYVTYPRPLFGDPSHE